MDLYTRQTLKTLGQHMSSVSVQVNQYRSDVTLVSEEVRVSAR